MLHRAVYWQLLFSNPCERVQQPKVKKLKEEIMMMNNVKFFFQILMNYLQMTLNIKQQ